MAEFTFDQLMRSGHVKRWQIVRVAREQTIAEHMYRVWLITETMCHVVAVPDELRSRAGSWALVHDLPEVVTGDIATPTKKAMREHLQVDDPMRRVELALSDSYARTWREAKETVVEGWPTAYELVKLADLIEAHCFLGCEAMGNHATEVMCGIQKAVTDREYALRTHYPQHFDTPEFKQFINDSWRKI